MTNERIDLGPTAVHYEQLVADLAEVLDVEAGLAEALQHVEYAGLVDDLGDTLDVEAGLRKALRKEYPTALEKAKPSISIPPKDGSRDVKSPAAMRRAMPEKSVSGIETVLRRLPFEMHRVASEARVLAVSRRGRTRVALLDLSNELQEAAGQVRRLKEGLDRRTLDRETAVTLVTNVQENLRRSLPRSSMNPRFLKIHLKVMLRKIATLRHGIIKLFDDSDTFSGLSQ